jgi:hypothetical protein
MDMADTQALTTTPDATMLRDDTAKPTFSFGMVFEINGTPVPISTADIAQIKKKGVQFELSSPVVLGSFKDLIDWLDKTFSVSFPMDTKIKWLDDIVSKVAEMEFKVTVFKLDVPGTERPDAATRFALEIAGQFPGEPLVIQGFEFLAVRGGVFGVTNIPPAIDN